jgi:cytochrome c peroxidase
MKSHMKYPLQVLCSSVLVLAVFVVAACGNCEEATDTPTPTTEATSPFEPLPELTAIEFDEDKMVLGRALYFDTRLSGDGTLSCASCHMLEHGGAEPDVVSTGVGGALGPINSPTVLNARYNFVQFWDGRAADLQAQASGPVANPIEMGSTWTEAAARIAAVPWYVEQFGAHYGGAIDEATITDAIAEYEKSLVTPSRFDSFLRGDESALSAPERRGHDTFVEVGCPACHQGINIGGSMYQKMGLVEDWFGTLDRELTEADNGRFNVTHDEADRHFFKVPTLRNIADTGPYLHDGSETELASVVRIMARHQLGAEVTDAQVADVVAFLESLSGELPAHAFLPEGGVPPGPEGEGTEGEGGATGEGATGTGAEGATAAEAG